MKKYLYLYFAIFLTAFALLLTLSITAKVQETRTGNATGEERRILLPAP